MSRPPSEAADGHALASGPAAARARQHEIGEDAADESADHAGQQRQTRPIIGILHRFAAYFLQVGRQPLSKKRMRPDRQNCWMQISHKAELKKIAIQGALRSKRATPFAIRRSGDDDGQLRGIDGGCSCGRLRNHTANQQAQARPGKAYSRNSQRQPSGPINLPVIHGGDDAADEHETVEHRRGEAAARGRIPGCQDHRASRGKCRPARRPSPSVRP